MPRPHLEPAFFDRCAVEVAPDLLGHVLACSGVGGAVVETEAYERDDPASHSYRGPTARNGSMFGPPGTVYVYRSYGIHWCFNIVCRPGSAVLVRALQPRTGIEMMRQRRGDVPDRLLCAGPGRLCQALGIDRRHDGSSILDGPCRLEREEADRPDQIAVSQRIGISKATDLPWRFGLPGSGFVSRPFR